MKHKEVSWCVYKWTCAVNGKVYIGMTNNIKTRIAQHRTSPPKLMAQDVLALGWQAFAWELLWDGLLSKHQAVRYERKEIAAHGSTKRDKGYNILKSTPGASWGPMLRR